MIKPECVLGYTVNQLEEILGDRIDEFGQWMRGQTMALCEGQRDGEAHGVAVYPWDLKRFLENRHIID